MNEFPEGHVKVPSWEFVHFAQCRKFPELIKQVPGSVDVSDGINETGEIDNKRTENMQKITKKRTLDKNKQ